MTQKNITGRWSFREDFGFGKDEGFAELTQTGDKVTGFVVFTERIEGDQPFRVEQEVVGEFDGTNLKLTAIKVEILDAEEPIEYHLDNWEGILNAQDQLVGHSYDNEDTFGVFLMERL
jgi:hypothetical protein